MKSNDPRLEEQLEERIQAIPEPNEENVGDVLLALKEAVETLAKLRGELTLKPVTFKDLQDLNIIDILADDTILNKLPFGKPNAGQTVGMLKFCNGNTEDFGQGIGWYFIGNEGEWYYLSNIKAAHPGHPGPP